MSNYRQKGIEFSTLSTLELTQESGTGLKAQIRMRSETELCVGETEPKFLRYSSFAFNSDELACIRPTNYKEQLEKMNKTKQNNLV